MLVTKINAARLLQVALLSHQGTRGAHHSSVGGIAPLKCMSRSMPDSLRIHLCGHALIVAAEASTTKQQGMSMALARRFTVQLAFLRLGKLPKRWRGLTCSLRELHNLQRVRGAPAGWEAVLLQ